MATTNDEMYAWLNSSESKEYFELLRFPTVGAEKERLRDCAACATWWKKWLKAIGAEAELLTVGFNPPVVFAERKSAESAVTVLVYGHYDVQPADPLDEWQTPPFEPTVRDDRICCRGAQDDKGQIFAFLCGLRALLSRTAAGVPNVKILLDGQEESGSIGLFGLLEDKSFRQRLSADVLLVSDTSAAADLRPAIVAGLRGVNHFTVTLSAANRDLHSGEYGGVSPNAAQGMAELIASLHHPDGSIAVAGFRDGVEPPSHEELEAAEAGYPDADALLADIGTDPCGGQRGKTIVQRVSFEPTIEVNGIHSGYGGPGSKTVIPCQAVAKLSTRLVPGQSPRATYEAVKRHLKDHCPRGMKVELSELTGEAAGFRLPLGSPLFRLAEELLREIDPRGAVFQWDGASIPVVSALREASGAAPLLVGWGQPEDRIHSPNESFSVRQFRRARVWAEKILSALCVVFVAAFFAVDAEAEEARRTEDRAWTIHRFRREFCGADVWEPFNRSMFAVFDWGMEYVVDPFCVLYSSIVPKPLIEGIDNFSENIEYPRRLVADLCMGEGMLAWDATKRFLINTTLGVGGLFDPAGNWFGIYDDNSSVSDAFSRWGVPSGPQLALPFMPRATVRGHVGYVLDYAFDPKTWFDFFVPSGVFIGYSWALTPNKGPVWNGAWQGVFRHEADTYSLYMPIVAAATDCNLRQKMSHVARGDACMADVREPVRPPMARPDGLKGSWREIPGYDSRGPALDSLRALCFTPLGNDSFWWNRRSIFNNDFSKKIDVRSVGIGGGVEAKYSFIKGPEEGRARLVVVIPGIGAGRTSPEVVAMGELLHGAGYSVVLCDSIFHWESMQTVNRGILPGNLTEDAKRFGACLQSILGDVREEAGDPEVSVIGWSMGGLATLHLAALDEKGLLSVDVKRFVAINPPPTSFERGLKPFTTVMEASRSWTREKAWENFGSVVGSLYGWVTQRHPRYDPKNPPKDEEGETWCYSPNLTEEQANYLMGLTLRRTLLSLVTERHRNVPFPWIKSELTWFHRESFYDEVGEMRLDDYLNKYLAACYPEMSVEELRAATEIRAQADSLRSCKKLSLIHTWNDPLLVDEDRHYLDDLFGERITWFADGAHCGYFYTKPFQDELLRLLRR